MRAFALTGFDAPAALRELPVPQPGPGEILVRIEAASLNAFDVGVAAGAYREFMEHAFPVIVGKDFAGVVEQLGQRVSAFSVGDAVTGITPPSPTLRAGSFAEYVAVHAEGFIALKPPSLSFTEAAAVGLAATAAQASIDAVDPKAGDPVLIVGATGGVGNYAVQLARARGADVVATGLPEDEDQLQALGATEVVDYTGDLVAAVRERHPDGVAALIDLVHRDAEAFSALAELVPSGGRAATTMGSADPEALAARGVRATNVSAQSDPSTFQSAVGAASTGTIRVPLREVLTLDEVQRGLDLIASGKARGKLVLTTRM